MSNSLIKTVIKIKDELNLEYLEGKIKNLLDAKKEINRYYLRMYDPSNLIKKSDIKHEKVFSSL